MDKIIVYYDYKTENIIDFFPNNISEGKKQQIIELWMQPICRKILKTLTKKDMITAPIIQEQIGHSMSTLHENIKRLEDAELIQGEMVYEGNKQKLITTNVIFVSKNTKLTEEITRFLNQGLWVDTSRSNKIIAFLKSYPNDHFTVEEISARTGIQVDEVQTLLDNWESKITRSFSDFFKRKPFEKRIMYKAVSEPKK